MITISKSGRFCAICGTTEEPFLDNLCEKCYKKENPLDIKVIGKIIVEICPLCGSIRIQGVTIDTWDKEEGMEDTLREFVRQRILEKIRADFIYDYKFDDNIEEDKIMNYGVKEFEVATTITAQPIKEFSAFEKHFTTRIKMERGSCDLCSKYKSGYFEAILQVRGENRKITETEQEAIEEQIDRIMNRYLDVKIAYILDFEADKDGINCNVSTKHLAETLAKEIKGATAGKMTVAYEHKTTSKDGLEVYTNTYLVRLPEYTMGDIVEYEKDMWLVKSITEAQVKLESLDNHEIKRFDRKRIETKGTKRSEAVVEREFMLVSASGTNVVIMALDNYENFDDNLARLPPNKQIGENIKGFIYEDKNYYLE